MRFKDIDPKCALTDSPIKVIVTFPGFKFFMKSVSFLFLYMLNFFSVRWIFLFKFKTPISIFWQNIFFLFVIRQSFGFKTPRTINKQEKIYTYHLAQIFVQRERYYFYQLSMKNLTISKFHKISVFFKNCKN